MDRVYETGISYYAELVPDGLRRQRGLGGIGKLSGRFDHLLSEVIRRPRFVPRDRQIRRFQKLFFPVPQRVANRLLHLRFGNPAQSR